ncbi:peptidylprolyl isomerase [Mycobacterium sp. NPDC050551]|uniref:peptidylprolyl isomerase n=1 Tax=Mycobacterium sp. NPDC050551 TaxID=3155407 RepID=UPI00341FADA4
MPTNEQRRAAAKRKLERQLERRAQQERRRRQLTIIGSVVGVLVVVGAAVFGFLFLKDDSNSDTASAAPSSSTTPAAPTPSADGLLQLPAFAAPAGLGSKCEYPAGQEPASKKVNPPRAGAVPTDPAEVSVSMTTNQGNLGLVLDNAKAPCTVNSFASLAQQGYFNDTVCHRLTASTGLKVLQCGDPTGKGTGGPGYGFDNEYPTNQFQPDDPALQSPVVYPRGTLAMANTGAPGSNGSQFFLVYGDSQLPPNYTVFGKIDETGLATLDKIAAAGVVPGERGADDGAPTNEVKVTSVLLD